MAETRSQHFTGVDGGGQGAPRSRPIRSGLAPALHGLSDVWRTDCSGTSRAAREAREDGDSRPGPRRAVEEHAGAMAGGPCRLRPEQHSRFSAYLREILGAAGLRLDTSATRGTPERFLDALFEATEGYAADPKLVTTFPVEEDAPAQTGSQVLESPVPFTALCEHHALPFFGEAWVAYVPGESVIGLSKLTRLVRQYSRRFTMQERLGREVARALEKIVGARGTAVLIEAAHLCTRMRGVRDACARTTTTTWRGLYAASPDLRAEFLALCTGRGR
jgi:GTP cyclohydrolase I